MLAKEAATQALELARLERNCSTQLHHRWRGAGRSGDLMPLLCGGVLSCGGVLWLWLALLHCFYMGQLPVSPTLQSISSCLDPRYRAQYQAVKVQVG